MTLVLALLCALVPQTARAAESFIGIPLGSPTTEVAKRLGGPPTSVESNDRGHFFTWTNAAGTLKLIVNNDALVQAIDLTPIGSPVPAASIDIDGRGKRLEFGTLTDQQADVTFSSVLDYGSATTRALRLTPTIECVLFFGKTHLLERAVFGSRGTLVALGLIADDPLTRQLAYVAPLMKRTKLKSYSGDDKRRFVARLQLDNRGIVRAVDVAVPSSDPIADARAAAELREDAYARAMLGARPIAATVYREVVPN